MSKEKEVIHENEILLCDIDGKPTKEWEELQSQNNLTIEQKQVLIEQLDRQLNYFNK